MVLVFRDVTARRQSEEQMRRLNHDLKRTNQDLQQFSYAASHDLKEPFEPSPTICNSSAAAIRESCWMRKRDASSM